MLKAAQGGKGSRAVPSKFVSHATEMEENEKKGVRGPGVGAVWDFISKPFSLGQGREELS